MAEESNTEPITLVTAFYDLGRADWDPKLRRNVSLYLDWFRWWARMQNRVVIFGEPEVLEKALAVRREFGREQLTHCIPLPFSDLIADEAEIYEAIQRKLLDETLLSFRFGKLKSWFRSPEYVYLIYKKQTLVNRAIQEGLTGEDVAWLDFGYGYGGAYYTAPEEFDFAWRPQLQGRFHLFSLYDVDTRPIFEIVRDRGGRFQASFMPAPTKIWEKMPALFRENMEHLLACDLPDTEQTILTMIYRSHPELFTVHILDYHQSQSIKLLGGEHLSVRKQRRYKLLHRRAKASWKDGRYRDAAREYAAYLQAKVFKTKE